MARPAQMMVLRLEGNFKFAIWKVLLDLTS